MKPPVYEALEPSTGCRQRLVVDPSVSCLLSVFTAIPVVSLVYPCPWPLQQMVVNWFCFLF